MIIIPAYNEDPGVLAATLQEWSTLDLPIVVVDDGSLVAVDVPSLTIELTVVRHATNRGQGAALRTGFATALARNASYVITVDADGQHRVEDGGRMVAALHEERTDVVFGSRFLERDGHRTVPTLRRMVLRLARMYSNYITGLPLTDAHNGLRVIDASVLPRIRITEDGMAHATEIPLRVKQLKLSWLEVPVTIRYTAYSQRKARSLLYAIPLLVRIWNLRGR